MSTANQIPHATSQAVDVLVVGGGINGAGIARDLSGRGLKVLLTEKDDLAAHTSSSSTKLIHGGLRYLEYYEFAMVRKSLAEREVLLNSAPHIMWPLRFVMPHDSSAKSARPVWMIRIGLFLYDHLAKREMLASSTTVDLRSHPTGKPLKPLFKKGFVYSDGWVDDARLVVLNAMDARERGAEVLTGWRCIDAKRGISEWQVQLQNQQGAIRSVSASALVNAAGPWAAQFLSEHVQLQANAPKTKSLRLIKGSHIVVPKIFDHDHAYIFQNADKRIIFAIPYEGDFTLIGTTDVEYSGPVNTVAIDPSEVAYLCEQASRYFAKPVRPADVVWSYSGVRPLLDDESGDPSAITRDYALELDTAAAPLLSVWGGKMTTFRKLSEEAADLLAAPLKTARGAWTHDAVLPGGDLAAWVSAQTGEYGLKEDGFNRFAAAVAQRYPHLSRQLAFRLARGYGTRVDKLMGNGSPDALGAEVAPGLFEAELNYLHRTEWARTAEDVLWRRTKLGLHFTAAQRAAVATWCATNWLSSPGHIASKTGPVVSAWN
ncbi:MAG: glycerol-3-phosphate dehydrogenase [Pseudorhodobacter sp.]|nr:glycerol-3-phosphate dehydrogenase [Rhizobacter sp.]